MNLRNSFSTAIWLIRRESVFTKVINFAYQQPITENFGNKLLNQFFPGEWYQARGMRRAVCGEKPGGIEPRTESRKPTLIEQEFWSGFFFIYGEGVGRQASGDRHQVEA
jgi:hypothetical protein